MAVNKVVGKKLLDSIKKAIQGFGTGDNWFESYRAGMQASMSPDGLRQERAEAQMVMDRFRYETLIGTPRPSLFVHFLDQRVEQEIKARKELRKKVKWIIRDCVQKRVRLIRCWEDVLICISQHCRRMPFSIQVGNSRRFEFVLFDLCAGMNKIPELKGLMESVGLSNPGIIFDLGGEDRLGEGDFSTFAPDGLHRSVQDRREGGSDDVSGGRGIRGRVPAVRWQAMRRNEDGTIANESRPVNLENVLAGWDRICSENREEFVPEQVTYGCVTFVPCLANGQSPFVDVEIPEAARRFVHLRDVNPGPVEVVPDSEDDEDVADDLNACLAVGAPGMNLPRAGARVPDAIESGDEDVDNLIQEVQGLVNESE